MTIAFMALGRIRRPEGLRHISPGEFGKRTPRLCKRRMFILLVRGHPLTRSAHASYLSCEGMKEKSF